MTSHEHDDRLFSSSAAMQRVLDEARLAATTQANIIICGEPGTGRELLAREIHLQGDEPDGPFVRVAHAGEPLGAFELDLFGYRAVRTDRPERRALERIGLGAHLHNAVGGTIYFANLAEFPNPVQTRLVRVFRDGEAVVVSGRKIELRMRAIAAVEPGYYGEAGSDGINRELLQMLAQVRIDVPPLRRRGEDIPALASFLLERSCRQAGLSAKQLTTAAKQLLSALPWHGNAVELQRLLVELAQRVPGDLIDLVDVLGTVQIDARARRFEMGGTLREARARFEREYIAVVMAQHQGRIPEAAKTLGVQRPNLYRKLRRLNVPKTSRRNSASR